uniref:Uncharacterized protein n=1 Tax=Anopheles albimanus TaxID=7167 RepID=A0A182FWZ0_ANOAL
ALLAIFALFVAVVYCEENQERTVPALRESLRKVITAAKKEFKSTDNFIDALVATVTTTSTHT